MTKIANSKEAMDALVELSQIMQTAGIDVTKRPSMMTAMKMSSNAEFRAAAAKVLEAFKKAGVEVNRDTVMQMFGDSFGSKGSK